MSRRRWARRARPSGTSWRINPKAIRKTRHSSSARSPESSGVRGRDGRVQHRQEPRTPGAHQPCRGVDGFDQRSLPQRSPVVSAGRTALGICRPASGTFVPRDSVRRIRRGPGLRSGAESPVGYPMGYLCCRTHHNHRSQKTPRSEKPVEHPVEHHRNPVEHPDNDEGPGL